MTKEKCFKLLTLLLEYLDNQEYINFNYIYGSEEEQMTVDELIEMLFQDYMR